MAITILDYNMDSQLENFAIERWLILRTLTNDEPEKWLELFLSIAENLQLNRVYKDQSSLQFILDKIKNATISEMLRETLSKLAAKLVSLSAFEDAGKLTHELILLTTDGKLDDKFLCDMIDDLDFNATNEKGDTPLAVLLQHAARSLPIQEEP